MRRWLTSPAIAAGLGLVCGCAAELRREGSIPAAGVRTVRITASGSISIRGAQTASMGWTAVSKMRQAPLESRRTSDELSVVFPDGDIAITLPRELRLCRVRTKAGAIQVRDLAGALELTSDGGQLSMDGMGGPVTARTVGGAIHIGGIDGDVRCFTGAGGIHADRIGGRAELETAGGEISVENVHGPLVASSAGGNIEIARADSSISARTSGGLIRVGKAAGPVIADTGSGAIQIAGTSGAICQVSEGGIQLKDVAGMVRAISGAGNIMAELVAGRRLLNSKLSTNAGDVTVLIPSSMALTIMAQSIVNGEAGRIITDFPEFRLAVRGGRVETAEGSLNGGGPVLQVVASGGTVYLRRRR